MLQSWGFFFFFCWGGHGNMWRLWGAALVTGGECSHQWTGHGVTVAITYPNGGNHRLDNATALVGGEGYGGGQSVRHRNKSSRSLWFCHFASSLSCCCCFVVLDLECGLNTSYLNYLVVVFRDLTLLVYFGFSLLCHRTPFVCVGKMRCDDAMGVRRRK